MSTIFYIVLYEGIQIKRYEVLCMDNLAQKETLSVNNSYDGISQDSEKIETKGNKQR